MKIKIGMQFHRRISNHRDKMVLCTVHDIITVVNTSLKTGESHTHFEYRATSDNYGMGKSFEVAKATIVRGYIEPVLVDNPKVMNPIKEAKLIYAPISNRMWEKGNKVLIQGENIRINGNWFTFNSRYQVKYL